MKQKGLLVLCIIVISFIFTSIVYADEVSNVLTEEPAEITETIDLENSDDNEDFDENLDEISNNSEGQSEWILLENETVEDKTEEEVNASESEEEPLSEENETTEAEEINPETVSEEIVTETIAEPDTEISEEEITLPVGYVSDTVDTAIYITQETFNTSECYIAHITTNGTNPFQTEYAHGVWDVYKDTGNGFVTGETASDAAKRLVATFLVNGDFRDAIDGFSLGIIRNGEIVNDKQTIENTIALTKGGNIVLVNKASVDTLKLMDVNDTFYFGPLLVYHGEICSGFSNWDTNGINPRTLIGQIYHGDSEEFNEYYIVVVDGRQPGYSDGLTLSECAVLMQQLGCDIAYNLDGGGSSTMVYQGQVINHPVGGIERLDCDFLYIQ